MLREEKLTMLRNVSEGYAESVVWWVNKPFIDREVEISQTELQCVGETEEKEALREGVRAYAKAWKLGIIEFIWEIVN